jgi:hypothetical protein
MNPTDGAYRDVKAQTRTAAELPMDEVWRPGVSRRVAKRT